MFNELSKIKPKRFTTVKNLLKPWILDILNKNNNKDDNI